MVQRWTEAELEFLSDHAGRLNNKDMARKLNRTEWAVKLKRCRLGLPTFFDNVYTYTILSQELGRSRRRIRLWVQRGWLKGRLATWKARYGKTPFLFTEDNIVSFLKEHYDLFNPRCIPNPFFGRIVERCQNKNPSEG